jgi:hypothetical protein
MRLPTNIEVQEVKHTGGKQVIVTVEAEALREASGPELATFRDRLVSYDDARGEVEFVIRVVGDRPSV